MESDEERKRRLEAILFPEAIRSAFDKMEREVEDLEASVDGRKPLPVAVVPARKVEKEMNAEEKAVQEWTDVTRKSSLKVGLLMGIVAWLGVGGWTGVGCYGCTEGGNAVFGAIGFVLVGVLSAFLIGVAGASISAFTACYKKVDSFDDATELFESVCWEEEDIAIGAVVLTVIGCLLALGVLVGAFFSLI